MTRRHPPYAGISELAEAADVSRTVAWWRMHKEIAPGGTLVSGGAATIWHRDDAVEYITGAWKAGACLVDGRAGRVTESGDWIAWRSPPGNVGGLLDLARAAEKSRAQIRRLMAAPFGGRRPPVPHRLRCGPVWDDFREVAVPWVTRPPAPSGRKPRSAAAPPEGPADGQDGLIAEVA